MATVYRRNHSKLWWVRFQLNGVRVQRSTGATRRADALRYLARAMEEERRRQEAGFKKVPFGVLCDEYRQQHLPVLKPRTRSNYLGHIKALTAQFGDRYIDEIRKADVAAFVAQQRRLGLKPCTVRRYLATLSSLYTFAERSGWIAQNLLARFDKRSLPEATPRTRFLTKAEYRLLLAAADRHLRPIIEMAVATGLRSEELLTLKWSQVDLDRREVRLEETKSKRPRIVPLTDRAVAIFVATRHLGHGPFVFTNPATGRPYRNLRGSFHAACRRAGITDFRFHDLRHTFASWAVQNGMDLYRLSRILGHSTLQMTTRYAHLATDQLHEAVRSMATLMATRSSDSTNGLEIGAGIGLTDKESSRGGVSA
jgi:integrase/recombinase XerD